MAITFKELSLIAELHYGKLPNPFKQKAAEFFHALDQDGDGAVTLPELLESNLAGKFGEEFIQHVFYNLDEEGKGLLEFRECLTLYYLCMYGARTCVACARNIPNGLGYTCRTCWKERQPPNNEFCVCLECFSSHNYQHEHGPSHFFHDFVLFDDLLHSKRPTSPPLAPVRIVEQTVKQCVKCGDYHESGVRGFTCDVHMSPMRGSPEFVCEWCFSYLCSKCGNLFRDSSTRAEPGKWLQRFVCPSCHQRNITLDCYEASLKNKLSGAELLRQCKTCEIKQRNGTLFWYVRGINTASAAASPAAPPFQPAWQAPAPSPGRSGGSSERAPAGAARPRGGSSEHVQQQTHSRNSSSGSSSDGHSFRSPQDSGSSHGGSSRVTRGGHNNRVNTQQPPPPRGAGRGAAPVNRPFAQDAGAVAARHVNRLVNAASANIFGGGGGGGGGNGGGGAGGWAGGGNPGAVDGGGGSGEMAYNGLGGDDGGNNGLGGDVDYGGGGESSLIANLSNLMGGGGDGEGDSGGFLSSIGSLVQGAVSDVSGEATW